MGNVFRPEQDKPLSSCYFLLYPTPLLVQQNKVCASGMKSVMLAAQAIQCGDAEIVVAGMENMSLIPHYMNLRNGTKFPATMIDGMQKDGLVDAYDNNAMGVCADLCAAEYNFSREE
jgi:acetyl-CoA C-acetyltransferase